LNILDIEIVRFMQNSELGYYFSETIDKDEFIFWYFKNNAKKQLSPKAYGRIRNEITTSNVRGFIKSYRASEKIIRAALKVRYLASTMSNLDRILMVKLRLEKYKIGIAHNIFSLEEVSTLKSQFKYGVASFPSENSNQSKEILTQYWIPDPARYHLLKDTLSCWGFSAQNYPAYSKDRLETITLVQTDNDREQQDMIALGKAEVSKNGSKIIL